MKTIKLTFTKSLPGHGWAYIYGETSDVPEKEALEFIDKGWANVHPSHSEKKPAALKPAAVKSVAKKPAKKKA